MPTFNPTLDEFIPIESAIINSVLLKGRLVVVQDLSGLDIRPHILVEGIESLSYMHKFGLFDLKFPEIFFNGIPTNKNKGMLIGLTPRNYPSTELFQEHLRQIRLTCQKYHRWAFVVVKDCDHPTSEYQADIVYRFDRNKPNQVKVVKNRLLGEVRE